MSSLEVENVDGRMFHSIQVENVHGNEVDCFLWNVEMTRNVPFWKRKSVGAKCVTASRIRNMYDLSLIHI